MYSSFEIRVKKRPLICLLTFFYNEQDMIPYFLKHYHFVTKIIAYDNDSSDNSD